MSVGVCDGCAEFFAVRASEIPETSCPRCGGPLRTATRGELVEHTRVLVREAKPERFRNGPPRAEARRLRITSHAPGMRAEPEKTAKACPTRRPAYDNAERIVLARELARKRGISVAALLRMLVREEARRQGIGGEE